MHARILIVTGTDTGVGKSVVASLLVRQLRHHGVQTLAMKPVSTGDRRDAKLLKDSCDGELSLEELNPFHFRRPLAPLIAARLEGRPLPRHRILDVLRLASSRCSCLVVEGVGGWLTPLGEGFSLGDLLGELQAGVFVVARNELGALHQVRATVAAIRQDGANPLCVVLSSLNKGRLRSCYNASTLRELLKGVGVCELPYLGPRIDCAAGLNERRKIFEKTLAPALGDARFASLFAAPEGSENKSRISG